MTRSRLLRTLFLAFLMCAAPAGCGRDEPGPTAPEEAASEPIPDITARITPIADDHFRLDVAFRVPGATAGLTRHYRVVPIPEVATGWTAMPGESLQLVFRNGDGGHRFLDLQASDPGLHVTQRLEFSPTNVLPSTILRSPRPIDRLDPIQTPTSFTMRWSGLDADGTTSTRPAGYVTRLVPYAEVRPNGGGGPTPGELVAWFTADRANNPGAWVTHGAADTFRTLVDLPLATQYFAVLAQDAAGDEESRLTLVTNLLRFRPSFPQISPRMTLFSSLFHRSRGTGRIDLVPWVTISLRSQDTFTLSWSAEAPTGRSMDGYRWAVDIADLEDETPRSGPGDVRHWSPWSLDGTSATVGPFPAEASADRTHHVFVMARDDLGGRSLAVMQIDILDHVPTADLLIIDDLYGAKSELVAGEPPGGAITLLPKYPMEAEQDSFHVAVGGFPDEFRIRTGTPGAISVPGAFAGYAADTLDYGIWREDGIPSPFHYRAVAWYTDNASAFRDGSKFGSASPSTAIRQINSVNRVNTLRQYVQQGGKLWIFGEGMTPAIANGYYSRFGNPPGLPWTAGEDQRTSMLYPGNFLFDFCKLRSELNQAGTTNATLTLGQQLHGAIPYLPEFLGPADVLDRSHDPRIGPGSARTAQRWAGLPWLTLRAYRGTSGALSLRSIPLTWVITKPLAVLENGESVLDTLYLNQGRTFDPNSMLIPVTDAMPNAVHYHGGEHGEVVWFGFPLHYFEPDQAREVVRVTMRVFGIQPQAPGVREGVGTAHPRPGPGVGRVADTDPVRRR